MFDAFYVFVPYDPTLVNAQLESQGITYCNAIHAMIPLHIIQAPDTGLHFAYECRKLISSLQLDAVQWYVLLEDDVSLTLLSLMAYWREKAFLMRAGRPDVHPFLPRFEYDGLQMSQYAPDVILNCVADNPDYACYVFSGLYRIGARWYVKPLSQYAASLIYSGSDVEVLKRKQMWTTFLSPDKSFPQEDAIGLNDYPEREHKPQRESNHGHFVRVIPISASTSRLRTWHMTNKFKFNSSVNLDDLIRCSGFELLRSGDVKRVAPQSTCRTLADGQSLPKEPPYSSMWKTIRPYPESEQELAEIDERGGDFR